MKETSVGMTIFQVSFVPTFPKTCRYAYISIALRHFLVCFLKSLANERNKT
uniref:hypothetical protein n=1 Tax=Agarivorans sp. TSD2052 TaxID=2937286 RepID=UPI003531D532